MVVQDVEEVLGHIANGGGGRTQCWQSRGCCSAATTLRTNTRLARGWLEGPIPSSCFLGRGRKCP